MKPFKHARISAKRFGGNPEEYIKFHEWMDQSKLSFADVRHRALLHHSQGIYMCAQFFGEHFNNSEGKQVSVRDVAEQHVIDDLGFIPSPSDWYKNSRIETWMGGNVAKIEYAKMRSKYLEEERLRPIKNPDQAYSFIDKNNAIVVFSEESISITIAFKNDMVKATGEDILEASNKLINILKKK